MCKVHPVVDGANEKKRGKMKSKVILCLILVLLPIILISAFAAPTPEDKVVLPNIPRIKAEELRTMIDKGGPFVVLDVRDSGSYEAGHIKGAVNVYYDANADPTERQMMLIALPMDKLIITYCDCTDDASSANMAQELYKLGYDRDKVKVLSGGSLRWVELKYPMVANK
jgi:rhodanese-related sulfurtransferase